MLEKVKTYLGITGSDKDSLLQLLIDMETEAFEDITGQDASDHDTIVLKMTVEAYNKYGSEGISNITFGNANESTLQNYSDGLQSLIKRYRKVRVI